MVLTIVTENALKTVQTKIIIKDYAPNPIKNGALSLLKKAPFNLSDYSHRL